MSFILLYDYRDPRLIEQTVDVDRPAAAERDRPEQAHPVIAAGGIGEVFEKGKERSGEADGSAALCAGWPLGLVHLTLR